MPLLSTATTAVDQPLREWIGPLIFWPLLIFLLGVIVWAYVRRARQSGGGRRAPGTSPKEYAEHHTVRWSTDPAQFRAAPAHWPLGVTAVFGICAGAPWDVLRLPDAGPVRDGLREAWAVSSRAELLVMLHWLLREGHRVGFAEETAGRAVQHSPGLLTPEEIGEGLWRAEQARTDARSIRHVRFEAWDLVRAAMLTRAGYSLGWLSEAEAIDTLNLVSAELQRCYASWEEMGDHFRRARWYWGGTSSPESRQNDAHDASRQAALLHPQRGPWSYLSWSQQIPRSRMLLVEALIAEELIVETPSDSPTPLAREIDRVTAARLPS